MSRQDSNSRQLILNFPARLEYTFDNFIVSKGSEFAWDAAREVASSTAAPYQTLFIAGDAGLGKTHLLMAIGNRLAETRHGDALYIHCRDFIDTIAAGPESAAEALKPLDTVEVLLMDDMDRIAGQAAAQETLYLIYNTLMETGKRLVFAGRRPPHRLPDTENYLRSRFKWGLTVELEPIDDATTARLVHKLSQDVGLEIPDKVVQFLLTRLPRDFSSIKESVARIDRESYARKQKVTLPLVKAALDFP